MISPIEDTPAFRAGIKAGDLIVKIDDVGLYLSERKGGRTTHKLIRAIGRMLLAAAPVLPVRIESVPSSGPSRYVPACKATRRPYAILRLGTAHRPDAQHRRSPIWP